MKLFKSSECGLPALALLAVPTCAVFAEASSVAVPTPPLTGLIISETRIDLGTIAATQPALSLKKRRPMCNRRKDGPAVKEPVRALFIRRDK